jgi:hypothetical protein
MTEYVIVFTQGKRYGTYFKSGIDVSQPGALTVEDADKMNLVQAIRKHRELLLDNHACAIINPRRKK